MDAFGRPQSVLVLGATSDIAQAILDCWEPSLRRLVLAGRPGTTRDEVAARWQHVPKLEVVDFDACETQQHEKLLTEAFSEDIDAVVLAFATLGDQAEFERTPARATEAAMTNYVGGVSAGLHVANLLEAQGHGTLVVLSSVAGERARRSNYVYGSTKAGLDTFATGLGDRLRGTGANVVVVRPGFVRTRMTRGLSEAPLAVDATTVASMVAKGVAAGSDVVYVPAAMRVVMSGLRHLPRSVFRRLPI